MIVSRCINYLEQEGQARSKALLHLGAQAGGVGSDPVSQGLPSGTQERGAVRVRAHPACMFASRRCG